jgi:hypothetical protein
MASSILAMRWGRRLGVGPGRSVQEDQVVRSLGPRLGIAGELVAFLWSQKLWWMIPLVLMLLVIGALVAFASATTLAPFIYPLI